MERETQIFTKRINLITILLLALSFCIFATAKENIPFDTNQLLAKIAHYQFRAGNRIILNGVAYSVQFNQDGLLLHAFNARIDNGKDIFIPIAGKPELKGGRVIYRAEDGKITFQAFARRLRFEDEVNEKSSFQDYLREVPYLIKSKSGSGGEENPFASGEFLIDTSVVPVPAPYFQDEPVIAFDGTNYLVVWTDWRGYTDIVCTRVNQAGEILDLACIPISVAPGYQVAPSVAFDGTNYFVVWEDRRRGFFADIYGARVTPAGVILDQNGFPISTALEDQWAPSVGFDGTNYLVVWEDFRNNNDFDIYGSRVSTAGSVIDPDGISISNTSYQEYEPEVVFGGNNYLVVWTTYISFLDSSDILGARINQAGTVLDPNGINISNYALSTQYSPTLVFDGTNYFIVWTDDRNGQSDIYGARLNQSGSVLDPTGIAIANASSQQISPSVTYDGTNYLMVWEDYRNNDTIPDIYAARMNQSGTVLDPGGIAISTALGDEYSPTITSSPTNSMIIWVDYRNGYYSDIYGARINQSGTLLDPNGIMLSTTADEQRISAAAFDGTNYLVVWEDYCKGDTSDIFGARITSASGILDPNHLVISSVFNSQTAPAIAFDGTNYLVVWSDKRSGTEDIYGARVNPSGVVLDPNGFAISTALNRQIAPKIAFDGYNYLVVWEDYRINDSSNIYGARVSQAGLVLDPVGFAIRADSGEQVAPVVAFDGLNYLVVWQDDNRSSGWDNILGILVSPSGFLDTLIIPICTKQNWQYTPSVAFDGINYLVAWSDARNHYFQDMDIYCARVNPSGAVLDPDGIPVATNNEKQISPAVTFDGANFLITWQDYRNGYYSDIYGAKVSRTGQLNGILPISIKDGDQSLPAVARGLNDQVLITYSGRTGFEAGKSFNSMRIWGKYCTGVEEFPNIGWSRKANVTGAAKNVKDGACLTALNDKVYALVGNNTRDLMVYDISSNTWTKKSEVPFSTITGKQKRVKKGACITNDGYYIYVIKGNNTKEFYRYDPYSNIWQELPQPNFEKGIKGGSMVYDGAQLIYLIGGSNRNEWRFFDVYQDTWFMPTPTTLPADKWKYGSFLVYANHVIYGLRVGGKTNEFYKLDFTTTPLTWTRVQDMPLYSVSGKKKKAKKGSCGAFSSNLIYGLKGGNTYEFYCYNPDNDSWTQKEDIGKPTGIPAKKVKGGGAITYSSLAGGLFALVGNNLNEFWFYLPAPEGTIGYPGKGVMSQTNNMKKDFTLKVSPNPCHQSAIIDYALPVKTAARIKIFNVSGKLVHQADSDNHGFLVNTKSLPAGVYILKFESGDYTATKKLLVAH